MRDDEPIPFLRLVERSEPPGEGEPTHGQRLAQELRQLAALAERGEVEAIGVVALHKGAVRTWFDVGTRSALELIGAARVLEADVMRRGLFDG